MRRTIPPMPDNEFFPNESPLQAFLRGHRTTSRTEMEKDSYHTVSTCSNSSASRATDGDCSISESELFDSLASIDFDINLDDMFDDEGDACVDVETASNTGSTCPKEDKTITCHLNAVDLALILCSNDTGHLGGIEDNDVPAVQAIYKTATTTELPPTSCRQQYIPVGNDAMDENHLERGSLLCKHDSDISLGEAFAKLHECMEQTSMTRELVRQFSQIKAFDNKFFIQGGSSELSRYTKHDMVKEISSIRLENASMRNRKRIAKCKTVRKTKTEIRSSRKKSSPMVTGVRPVNWDLI